MRSLISQIYKNTNWVFAVFLVLTLVGCGRRGSSPAAPQVEGGLNIEVVAGRIQIGESTSNRFAGVGETFSLTMGNRISTNQAEEAELAIAGNTRMRLAPNATLELANQDIDTAVILRQLGGTVTFDLKTPTLSVTGSTGLGFGSGGLERVKFLVKALTEDSVFTVDVGRNNIKVTVKEGEVAVDIDDEGYQLQPGESLSAESSDQVEISRALTERPLVDVAAGSVKVPTQSLGSSGQPAITSTTSETVTTSQVPNVDDLSSSEEAPQLLAPPNGTSFSSAEIITLNWQSTAVPDQDTWFEVQLWRNDDSGFGLINIIQDTEWQPLETLVPGEYQWHVQLIRLSDRQYLSPPSEIGNFIVIAPTATPTVTPTYTPAPIPSSTPTSVPISTPTEVVTDTATPAAVQASYPEVVLTGPEANKVFTSEEPITLRWQSVGTLGDNQWYEVRVLRNGTEWLGAFKTKEPEWPVPAEYNPGIYGWRVAVIVVENREWAGDISPESEMRLFTWDPPPQPPSGDGGDDKGSNPPGSR